MKEIMYKKHTIIVTKDYNNTYEAVVVKPNGAYITDLNQWEHKVVVMVTGNTEEQAVEAAKELVLEDIQIYGK